MHQRLLRSFELLDLQEKIAKIMNMLSANGYTIRIKDSKCKYVNIYYTKDGVDYAFVVIKSRETGELIACHIIDADTEKELRSLGCMININNKDRKTNKVRYKCDGGKTKLNMFLHTFVMQNVPKKLEDTQVDHICHSYFIHTKEMLKHCTAKENNNNKKGKSGYVQMVDYENTWYAYMLYRLLGVPKTELDIYQRNCITRGIV